jgi:hypothetical protein
MICKYARRDHRGNFLAAPSIIERSSTQIVCWRLNRRAAQRVLAYAVAVAVARRGSAQGSLGLVWQSYVSRR